LDHWKLFWGIQSLFACVSLQKWHRRIDLELVVSPEVFSCPEELVDEKMDEIGLLGLITFLHEEDGPDFDFVRIIRPKVWACFILSMESTQTSRIYLDTLRSNCTLMLRSLMVIDSERQRLLSLVEDIDCGCDAAGCEFWLGVLIWLGSWFYPANVVQMYPRGEDVFDFQSYLIDADFDFNLTDNLEFRLVYDFEEGNTRPFGVWILTIVDRDLCLILDKTVSFGEYWKDRDLICFAVNAPSGEFGIRLGDIGKILDTCALFHVAPLAPGFLLLGAVILFNHG
jgi:hypothetical protein